MMVEILESEVWLFCDYFVKGPDALCLCFFVTCSAVIRSDCYVDLKQFEQN